MQSKASLLIRWAALASVGQDAVQFFGAIVLTRLITPAEYGAFYLAQGGLGLASALSISAVVPAIHLIPRSQEFNFHHALKKGLHLNGLLAALGLATFLLAPSLIGNDVAPQLIALTLTVLVLAPFALLSRVKLEREHAWSQIAKYRILGTSTGILVAIMLAKQGAGPYALASTLLVSELPLAFYFFTIRRPSRSAHKIGRREWNFGVTRATAGAIQKASSHAQNVAILYALSASDVGFFQRALGLSALLVISPSERMGGALMPLISQAIADRQSVQASVQRCLVATLVLVAPISAGLAMQPDLTIVGLYGYTWVNAIPLLPASLIFASLKSLRILYSNLLVATGAAKPAVLVECVTCVGLAAGLMSLFQGNTVAFILTLALGECAAICTLLLNSELMRLATLNSAVSAVRISGALLVAATISSITFTAVEPSSSQLWRLPAWIALFAVCYIGSLRVFAQRELESVLSVLPIPKKFLAILALRYD